MFTRRLVATVGWACKRKSRKFYSTVMQRQQEDRRVRLCHTAFQTVNQASVGPPIIIIHGLFGSKRNWNSLAKAISRKGNKVVTVDCRNHGESPHVPTHTYPEMAEDIELLMEEMEIPEAIILGHSMGGKVAMNLALKKPELVTKLIVEDISPGKAQSEISVSFVGYIDAMLAVKFDNSLTMAQLRKYVDEQLQPTFPDKGLRSFILTNIDQRDDEYQWRVNLQAIRHHLADILSFPHFTSSYQGETLFIGGRLSKHISENDLPEIRRLFPKADVKYIEGAGHWVHAEKPADFLKMFLQFVNGH